VGKKRPTRKPGRGTGAARGGAADPLKNSGITLDAEDIALARLQAHLRKTETIQAPPLGVSPLSRTSVRLPTELLRKVRERARREGLTVSEIVEGALESYLRSR